MLSHTENRNVEQPDSPFNTLSFRIDNPPKPDQIVLDEVCHAKEVETDWSQCITEKDGVLFFMYVFCQTVDSTKHVELYLRNNSYSSKCWW